MTQSNTERDENTVLILKQENAKDGTTTTPTSSTMYRFRSEGFHTSFVPVLTKYILAVTGLFP